MRTVDQDTEVRFPARSAVEKCLANIERLNKNFNIMITIVSDAARESADRCDRAAREGRWLGLLHGVPIVLKDNMVQLIACEFHDPLPL